MVIKRFLVLSIFICVLFSLEGSAQKYYRTALGLRGGYPSGLTAKHFLDNATAVEGILSFGKWGVGFTALYQIHVPVTDAPYFNWYYGGGGHIGSGKAASANPFQRNKNQEFFLGVDGVFGIEYVFSDVPISLSLDVTPMISLLPEIYPWFNAGLSVRYTF